MLAAHRAFDRSGSSMEISPALRAMHAHERREDELELVRRAPESDASVADSSCRSCRSVSSRRDSER